MGHRESSTDSHFIGSQLLSRAMEAVALLLHRGRSSHRHWTPQRLPGMFSASTPMAGYPKAYNIQMDPHEDL